MLSLVVMVFATLATGFLVWANDKRHGKYGIALPAGISVGIGALSWIAFIAAGMGYQPGLTWIPWILPIVLGTATAAGTAVFLGRTRTARDTAELTKALRL
ncbi:hypothetical protein AAHB33_13550 [Paenarthrobacter sp. S56]|uniref:hypothetical protein n=1 Tax=Paenarthrobacter sp. S56 TaxID=3138179 RepID=UPI00321AF609